MLFHAFSCQEPLPFLWLFVFFWAVEQTSKFAISFFSTITSRDESAPLTSPIGGKARAKILSRFIGRENMHFVFLEHSSRHSDDVLRYRCISGVLYIVAFQILPDTDVLVTVLTLSSIIVITDRLPGIFAHCQFCLCFLYV